MQGRDLNRSHACGRLAREFGRRALQHGICTNAECGGAERSPINIEDVRSIIRSASDGDCCLAKITREIDCLVNKYSNSRHRGGVEE